MRSPALHPVDRCGPTPGSPLVRLRRALLSAVLLVGLGAPAPPAMALVDGGLVAEEVRTEGIGRTRVLDLAPSRVARFGLATDGDEFAWWTSPVLAVVHGRVVGVEGVSANTEAQVRARTAAGWEPWLPLPVNGEEGPDPDTDEGRRAVRGSFSLPVHVGDADAVQVRARGLLGDRLQVHVVEDDGDAAAGLDGSAGRFGRVEPKPEVEAPLTGAPRPAIGSRASWGADESQRYYVPELSKDVRFAIVHHTAGRTDYAQAEVPSILRSITRFHTVSQGWDDIGYNFAIDRFGGIWEGRSGGVERAVSGGHAYGFNDGSTGIVLLGTHDTVEPSAAALQALEDLLAWKLDVHHVDPTATTDELAGKTGGSNRHEEGDDLTFPTIIDHRTNNATSCPGARLHAHVYGLDGRTSLPARVDARDDHPKIYGGLAPTRELTALGVPPRVQATFSRPSTWAFEVRGDTGGAGTVLRRAAGSGDAVDLTWDLRDDTGSLVPPGTYELRLTATDGRRAARPLTTLVDVVAPAERLAGDDRVATSIALSQWAFPSALRVVLASSMTYADALAATPLAGSYGSPVLLVPPSGLTPALVDEIRRLGSEKAVLVGGVARLPESIVGQLAELGIRDTASHGKGVERFAGADRYLTAQAVAAEVFDREEEHVEELLIALGSSAVADRAFPDALSAGAYGASERVPLLLTRGGELPEAVHVFVRDGEWERVRVFGGTAAVADGVLAQVRDLVGAKPEIVRVAGDDRYATSVASVVAMAQVRAERAAEEPPNPYVDPTGLEVVLASGKTWPDALGAAAAAARRGAVFLLSPPSGLAGSATGDALRAWASPLSHVVVAGGRSAVSDVVLLEGEQLARSDGPHLAPAPLAGETAG